MTNSLDRETHARGAISRRALPQGRPARGIKRRRDIGFFFVLLSPTLLIVTATLILPLAMLVAISVRDVGLAPLSISSDFYRPLTLVIIFGLISVSILALVVVPALYLLLTPKDAGQAEALD